MAATRAIRFPPIEDMEDVHATCHSVRPATGDIKPINTLLRILIFNVLVNDQILGKTLLKHCA